MVTLDAGLAMPASRASNFTNNLNALEMAKKAKPEFDLSLFEDCTGQRQASESKKIAMASKAIANNKPGKADRLRELASAFKKNKNSGVLLKILAQQSVKPQERARETKERWMEELNWFEQRNK